MNTGFIMIPQNIKSQSTALIKTVEKLLPAIIPNISKSLITTNPA